jgi:hypothetical protein
MSQAEGESLGKYKALKKRVEQKNLAYKKYLQRPETMRFGTSAEQPLPKEKSEKDIANRTNNYHHS